MKKPFLLFMIVALVLSFSTAVVAQDGECEVNLTFWHHWGGNRVPLMDAQVEAFEAANPGVCVETVFLPWDNRLENLLTSVAAGTPPDVTMFGRQDLPGFAVLDAIIPLDAYMEADGISPDIFIPSEFEGNQYNGQTYMLPQPTGGSLNIIWYNKDHFREAGLDPENFPETWAELREAAEQLTIGADGFLDRVGIDVLQSGGEQPAFLMWLNANGQDWISSDLRTVTINNQAGIETLEFIKSFTDEVNFGVEEVRSFYEGGAELDQDIFFYDLESIQTNGSWVLFQIEEFAPHLDYGIAAVPYGPSGSPDRRGSTYGGWGYMIPQNAAHPDEAWQLVKWMTTNMDDIGACWFIQQQQRPSPLTACDGYLKDGESHPRAAEILQVAALDNVSAISPVQPQLLQVITEMTDSVLYNDATVEDALTQAEIEIQDLLDTFWAEYS